VDEGGGSQVAEWDTQPLERLFGMKRKPKTGPTDYDHDCRPAEPKAHDAHDREP